MEREREKANIALCKNLIGQILFPIQNEVTQILGVLNGLTEIKTHYLTYET